MSKHRTHVVTRWRGRPVKPKRQRRAQVGRPRVLPVEDVKLTMVRSTEEEREQWDRAAAEKSLALGLPEGKLTVGPWLRMLANAAAKAG